MVEDELIILEQQIDKMVSTYNNLLMRHKQLQEDFTTLSNKQENQTVKTDQAVNKITTLIDKLRKIEEAHER